MCHKLGIIDCLQKLGVFLGLSLSLLEYFEFVEITFSVSINRINVKVNQNSPQKFDFTVEFMYILVIQSCNKIALFGT